jgi:hypothetical protein
MCKCTPEIRTPFCGKPGCEWPREERQPGDAIDAAADSVTAGWTFAQKAALGGISRYTLPLADAALRELKSRKGFDAFWDGVDSDVQEEVRESLALRISEALREGN